MTFINRFIPTAQYRAVLALCFFSLTFTAQLAAAQTKKPKNVVFILVDDLGWADLSCYGSTFHETPNLDRLAKSGVRFTDAYASCPVCSPTRASILTGRYPARLNITDWIPGQSSKGRKLATPEDLDHLPLTETTLAEALRREGYATFFAGKWHLGDKGFFPEDQGFDINIGGHHKGSPPGGYYSPYKNPKLPNKEPGEYLPDRLTNESISFLESAAKGDKPFLLYLSYYTVHTPVQPDKKTIDHFRKKADKLPPLEQAFEKEHDGQTRLRQDRPDFASMVAGMDRNVGRLLQSLDDLNLTDDTAVFFTSDNGGLSTLAKKRNGSTSNAPLRAGKGWCYEGGIRVPCIVRVPGMSKAGLTSSAPIISTDFYPTILEVLGLDALPLQHVDGVSFANALRDENPRMGREVLYWHYPHYHGSSWTPGAAMRMGDWKLIEFYDKDKTELYNLKRDLGERDNLAESNPEVVQKLRLQLQRWQKHVRARMPSER